MDLQGFELHALQGANRVLADNPDIKLLLEFRPLALKQVRVNANDFIAALQEKGLVIRQVSSEGLIPLSPDWISENPDWYVNLFASGSESALERFLPDVRGMSFSIYLRRFAARRLAVSTRVRELPEHDSGADRSPVLSRSLRPCVVLQKPDL